MQTSRNELLMTPGDVATYWKDRQTADVKQISNVADKFAWSNNHLIISGERLEDIARMLERRYDVRIVIINPELKDDRYTGKFVYNETVQQVLKVISLTTKMQYEIEKNEIIISK
jgi:ferric-dicitrate binding protein FerR (iron transport regulator)